MMIFEFTDAPALQSRIAMVALGRLGARVIATLRNEYANDGQISLATVGEGAVDTFSLEGTDRRDLVFVFVEAGPGGTVDELLHAVAHADPDLTQAVIAVVAVPLASAGYSSRMGVEYDLSRMSDAGVMVIAVSSDSVLRKMEPAAAVASISDGLVARMARAAQSIVDLVRVTGQVNVDLADVRLILSGRGLGFFTHGEAHGRDRGVAAAMVALEEARELGIPLGDAQGCLISISGGFDLGIDEVVAISQAVQAATGDDTEIVFGALHDPASGPAVTVAVIVTGYELAREPHRSDFWVVSRPDSAVPRDMLPAASGKAGPVRVFLASPADVAEERSHASAVIQELNLVNGERWGTTLELVTWETHALPGAGRAQDVVNQGTQFEAIDVFVGILWSRLVDCNR